jgi:hypothetical protein
MWIQTCRHVEIFTASGMSFRENSSQFFFKVLSAINSRERAVIWCQMVERSKTWNNIAHGPDCQQMTEIEGKELTDF